MRVSIAAAAALLIAAFALAMPSVAGAQPGHEGHNHAQNPAQKPSQGKPTANQRPAKSPAAKSPARGRAQIAGKGTKEAANSGTPASGKGFTNTKGESGSPMAALIFWLLGAMVLGGSLFVITRRNMVTAVMGMVGTFIALAGLYAMLYAHFLAAIQVVVYAGAIMVLFVFVIMILNRPESEPWGLQGVFGKAIAGLSLAYLVYRLAGVLWTVKDATHASEAPITPGGFEFGSTKAVGKVLFTDYLFPFEAVSIVLLVSVVGAIAIARPKKNDPTDPAENGDAAESAV